MRELAQSRDRGRESKIRGSSNYPTAISYLFHLRAVYNEPSITFITTATTTRWITRTPAGDIVTDWMMAEMKTRISASSLRKLFLSCTDLQRVCKERKKEKKSAQNQRKHSRFCVERIVLFRCYSPRVSTRQTVFFFTKHSHFDDYNCNNLNRFPAMLHRSMVSESDSSLNV